MARRGSRMFWVVAWMVAGWAVACGQGMAQGEEGASPAREFLPVVWGETVPAGDESAGYERVLVGPAVESTTLVRAGTWQIDALVAAELAQRDREERWRIILRNLDLDPTDRVLWREVSEAVFDAMAGMSEEGGGSRPPFAIRVAFSEADEAQVVVGFGEETELAMKAAVRRALTGIEGFVVFEGAGLTAAPRDTIRVRLLDEKRQQAGEVELGGDGYFCFPGLAVDERFGSDYYLQVVDGAGEAEKVLAIGGSKEPRYAPVKLGRRTRLRLVAAAPEEKGWGVMSAGLLDLDVAGTEQSILNYLPALVRTLVEKAEKNPGLHAGAVFTPDDGVRPVYAIRIPVEPAKRDRGPRVSGEAMMRLECWSGEEGASNLRYVRIVLVGRPGRADLDLESRPFIQSPWAVGAGIVPTADPEMFVLGLSYGLSSEMEALVGLGQQENNKKSFVYGLTLDLGELLGGVFGGK